MLRRKLKGLMDSDGVEGQVQSNVCTEKGSFFLDIETAFQIRGKHSEEGKGSETLLEWKPGSELLSKYHRKKEQEKRKKKVGGEAEEEKKIAGLAQTNQISKHCNKMKYLE